MHPLFCYYEWVECITKGANPMRIISLSLLNPTTLGVLKIAIHMEIPYMLVVVEENMNVPLWYISDLNWEVLSDLEVVEQVLAHIAMERIH